MIAPTLLVSGEIENFLACPWGAATPLGRDQGAGVAAATESDDARDLGQRVTLHFKPVDDEHVPHKAQSRDVAPGRAGLAISPARSWPGGAPGPGPETDGDEPASLR
jgi:hypothetical protein